MREHTYIGRRDLIVTILKSLCYQLQPLSLIVHFKILMRMGRYFRQCLPLFQSYFFQASIDIKSKVDMMITTKESCSILMLLFAIAGHQLGRLDYVVGYNKSFNWSTTRDADSRSLPASDTDDAGYVLIR